MAQFDLNWFAAPVMVNTNATGQRASYRQKSIGGSWITTGFTPTNPLAKTAQFTKSPNIATNVVWEFLVEALCTVGGPTSVDNGIQEAIRFECMTPSLTWDTHDATIQLNVNNTDITKAQFILYNQSDDTVAVGPVTVNRTGSIIQYQAVGLTPNTGYYWTFVLYATVNGVEISSTIVGQLPSPCVSADFTTDLDVCLPVTALTSIAQETA